jgi:hypothetical protein
MSTEKQSCQGFFGFLFGHDYAPRYNIATLNSADHHCPPNPAELGTFCGDFSGDEQEGIDTIEKMHRKGNDTEERTYICDVCNRCGHVVKP